MKKYILILGLLITSLAFSQGYKKNVYNVGDSVGVFTTTPLQKFHVEGKSYFSDNVGIGTASPVGRLDLSSGELVFGNILTAFKRNAAGDGLQLSHWGNVNILIDSDNNDSNRIFSISTNSNESSTATELMRVDEAGNGLFSGNLTANSFIKDGGLSTEFLKADGSVSTGIAKSDLAVALKTKVALGNVSGTVDIDTSLGIHFTMTMTGNITSLTFSNLTNEELKTITLQITGNFTIAQPSSVKGDWTGFDGTKTNQIQIYLFDIGTPVFSSALLNW